MKLLFDENLSHHLVERLADVYPGSQHVRQLGMKTSPDRIVLGRDLERPVDVGLLVARGEKRGRFYVAHERLIELGAPIRRRGGGFNQDDPFA